MFIAQLENVGLVITLHRGDNMLLYMVTTSLMILQIVDSFSQVISHVHVTDGWCKICMTIDFTATVLDFLTSLGALIQGLQLE